MAKQEFSVEHNGKAYNCYIDTFGDVWVAGSDGIPQTGNSNQGITNIEVAKKAAINLIKSFGF